MDANEKFEDLFDQLSAILQTLEINANKPIDASKITPEFMQRLAELKENIDKFAKVGKKVKDLNEESIYLYEQTFGKLEVVPTPQSRRILEKSKKLKEQAEALKKILGVTDSQVKPADETPEIKEKAIDDKSFIKRRRRKFKQFGGD